MREVETQPVGRDQRALLRHVIAEHLAQRFVQQMRRRMVFPDRAAAVMIDFERERGADLERAFLDDTDVHEHVAEVLLRVGDLEAHAIGRHHPGIADLAAGLAVERRLVEHDGAAVAFFQRIDFLAVAHERGDDAFGAFGLVAEEFGAADFFADAEPHRLVGGLAGARPRRARLLALLLHGVGEGRDIDADAARPQRVLGEIERKAVGVVQRERGHAVEHVAFLERLARLVEDREAALERAAEAGLFELQRLGDQRVGAMQFRIGLAHLAHQYRHEAPHQRVFGAEQLGVAHAAAHDAAEHVAAAFVRRQHAVGDQECRRAQMVGDDAVRAPSARRRDRRR